MDAYPRTFRSPPYKANRPRAWSVTRQHPACFRARIFLPSPSIVKQQTIYRLPVATLGRVTGKGCATVSATTLFAGYPVCNTLVRSDD